MAIQLDKAALIANNEAVGIDPNSIEFTEGEGEKDVRAMSLGAGVEQVSTSNQESAFSELMFSLPSTVENVRLVKEWLTNGNTNVFQVIESNADGIMTRTFTQALVVNNPKVKIGTEGSIEIEIKSNAAI